MDAAVFKFLMFAAGLACFGWLELRRPYRPPSQPRTRRWLTNLGLTAVNNLGLALIFGAATAAVTAHVAARQVGVLNMTAGPAWLKTIAAVALLDFMLYVWHLLNHEVPLLWRFHRVHHSDLNMDVSTSTRFHLGELILSVPIKMGLIYMAGVDWVALLVFETAVVLQAQFHHSSLRLPEPLDRAWGRLFIPPSLHRVHHSVIIRERNSNYGTILSLWDRLMGTLNSHADQSAIRIGVGAYPRPEKLGLTRLLVMPFTRPVR